MTCVFMSYMTGAVLIQASSGAVKITSNSTFTGNRAPNGGGMFR